jgi:hypothetical protein
LTEDVRRAPVRREAALFIAGRMVHFDVKDEEEGLGRCRKKTSAEEAV